MEQFYQIHTNNYTGEPIPEYYKFSYPLDHFQLHGANAIANNENLLVTAHTGSGKTVLALYAIAKCLSEGKKVIYTSPIKTLSNQKFAEFNEQFIKSGYFPNKSIGIMTGDIKINPVGDLLIMTAEILRNSLLRKPDEQIYEWTFNPNDVGCVILDEVHFINNPNRGKVWEEIIINLPKKIQLVMLSATITGAEEMCKWVGNLKQITCHLTTTNARPVPLQHGIWFQKHQKDNDNVPTVGSINYFLYGDNDWKEGVWSKTQADITKYYSKHQYSIDTFFNCIKHLFDSDMTPCNVFLLNRSLLEQYARKIPYCFVSYEEQAIIKKIWNKHLHKYSKLYETSEEWVGLEKLVSNGIGIHHSGMIPILKEVVEILYSEGLIKVLLATETFAMGVNMPTKTVVFCQLNKFDGAGLKRILRPEEYGQMAGRAGRRGKDPVGHVVILPTLNFMSEAEAKNMIMAPPQKIASKFSIDPIYVLKQISYLIENSNQVNMQMITERVISNCSNSLLNLQNLALVSNVENQYIKYLEQLNQMKTQYNFSEQVMVSYSKLQEIETKLKPFGGIVRLAPKIEKKLLQEKAQILKQIPSNDLEKIIQYYNIKKQINELEIHLEIGQNKIKTQVEQILEFLSEFNYVDTEFKLTKIGKIISETNECNGFLLGELIQTNYFDDLSFSELVGVLSIFLNEGKSQDEVYIGDLICDDSCKPVSYTHLRAHETG
jgi:superfamily II RNA helicase